MKEKNFGLGMLAIGLLCALIGCTTTIPVRVTDPARLNMSGVTRIAILPFDTSGGTYLQRQMSQEIAAYLNQQINNTGRFQMVSVDGIAQQDRASIADAVISGQIIVLSVRDTSTTAKRTKKDADGNTVEYTEIIYHRELKLELVYTITRTRDNFIIVTERKSATATDQNSVQAILTAPDALAQRAVSSALGKIAGDVAPSTHIENRTLATLTKEESKDKELKGQMAEALKRVKAKDYAASVAMYGSIYAARGTFAAGYNRAVLTEATDGVEAAIGLMADLVQKTNNPMAVSMLASMRRASSGEQLAAQQRAEGRPLEEVAIEQASWELLAKLPAGSRISLVDTSRVKTALLDSVIGGIFDNLVTGGITVLDRQNQRLIDMEKQYQLSGDVSDNTVVSIGHALGLTSIILCSIDGEGRQRRLRVRAVSIETGEIIYTVSLEI